MVFESQVIFSFLFRWKDKTGILTFTVGRNPYFLYKGEKGDGYK